MGSTSGFQVSIGGLVFFPSFFTCTPLHCVVLRHRARVPSVVSKSTGYCQTTRVWFPALTWTLLVVTVLLNPPPIQGLPAVSLTGAQRPVHEIDHSLNFLFHPTDVQLNIPRKC